MSSEEMVLRITEVLLNQLPYPRTSTLVTRAVRIVIEIQDQVQESRKRHRGGLR